MNIKELKKYLKNRDKNKIRNMAKNFMKTIKISKEEGAKKAKARKKLYEKQLAKKQDNLDAAQKREFKEREHMYENDEDVAKKSGKTDENEDIAQIPGQLFETAVSCSNCGGKFSTRASFRQHQAFQNDQDFKRRYVARSGYIEKENVHIVCPSVHCCFHTYSLQDYDSHMLIKHKAKKKKANIPVYQHILSNKDIKEMRTCERCEAVLKDKYNLIRHKQICMGYSTIICGICQSDFRTSLDFIEHVAALHKPPTTFKTLNSFREKQNQINKKLIGNSLFHHLEQERLKKQQTGLKTLTKFFTKLTSLEDILQDAITFEEIRKHLKYEVEINAEVKFYIFLPVILSKPSDNGGEDIIRSSVIQNSISYTVGANVDVREMLRNAYSDLWSKSQQVSLQNTIKYYLSIIILMPASN